MPLTRLRLHHRIALPYVVVALFTTSVAAYVAVTVASDTLEARAKGQLLSAARVIGRSDLALNPAVLENFRDAAATDVVTFVDGGEVLAATLEGADRAPLRTALQAAAAARRTDETGAATAILQLDCGFPCFVAARTLQNRPEVIVALVANTSDLAAAQTSIARSILLTALFSAIVVVLVSQVVARRITAPLAQLVAFTRDVMPAETRRALVTADEIGDLATAFNDMLDRLDEARDALIKSEKLGLAGVMAAQVAHDIRNPLSSIKMQTQIVRSRLRSDSDEAAALAAVLDNINQVESVIQDLLELARPGSMNLQPANLNDVVKEVVHQLAAQLEHRKIRRTLQLDESLPPVALDVIRFKRALVNLVVNASDALPAGGNITVTTRSVDAGRAVQLEVTDDGSGVDPSVLDRVFDPFISTKPDGIGLGLVNVQTVVHSHGGTIALHPALPHGTRAVLQLPAATTGEPVARSASRGTDG